jgi:glycine oxidase
MTGADVVVVGGGVIGLSVAWEASSRGLSVCVVDPSPGHGASWVAAGMLAPVTEATFGEATLVRLLLQASERWPSFVERLSAASGEDPGFRACGTVVVAADGSDRAAIDRVLAYQHELGLAATRLSANECRAVVPSLAPGIRGGATVPGDHQVDNRRLVAALLAACAASGVTLVPDQASAVALGADGGATGVVLTGGSTLAAGTVVAAAGARTPCLGGLAPGVLPPVRPVKGHVVRLRGTASRPLLERTLRGLVHGRPCYLVPRDDGSLVVGATTEERGFDTTVQAGAVHTLLDDARSLVPGIDELELVECLAGLRPGSPDNCPWVGPTAVPRLVAATGHYRNGILLTPITADAVATFLTTGSVPAPLDAFAADRTVGDDPAAAAGAGSGPGEGDGAGGVVRRAG